MTGLFSKNKSDDTPIDVREARKKSNECWRAYRLTGDQYWLGAYDFYHYCYGDPKLLRETPAEAKTHYD